MTVAELSTALAVRGLIAEDRLFIDPGPQGNLSPWYVQVMMGACAWFAGLLLLAFAMLSLESVMFRDWGVLLFLGIGACAVAALLYAKLGEKGAFANQFALSMSCAGQVGIGFAINGLWGERASLWGILFVEIGLVFVMRSRLHRIISSFGAVIAYALATHEFLFGELPGITFHAPQSGLNQATLMPVVLWILVWAPIAYAAYWLVAGESKWLAEGRDALLRPVTHGLIAALAIAPLATHPASFWMVLGLGSTRDLTDGSLGATALWPLLAILLALLALALAFTLRSRPLMGVAIVFALLEIAAFYYVLGTTLLIKSIVMLAIGAALLVSARLLGKETL